MWYKSATLDSPTSTRVLQRLQHSGHSGAWLGKKLGISRQTINSWLRGEEKCPPARRAQIAIHLETTEPLFDINGFALHGPLQRPLGDDDGDQTP